MLNKPPENCIIDCRVSDEIQLKGGSLDNQDVLGRAFAMKNNWNVLCVFKKQHSATTTVRDDLDEIIEYIKNSDVKVHHYIFKSIDRFTREGVSEYQIIKGRLEKMGIKVWDTAGIIQQKINTLAHLGNFKYKWSDYSPSEGAEFLAAHGSKQEWREIMQRLITAEIILVQAGYVVRRPIDGLKSRRVIVGSKECFVADEDEERAKFFRAMFKFRADGLDDKEIISRVNAMGYRTRSSRRWNRDNKEQPVVVGQRGGNPLTVKQLQRYIQQTIYAGINSEFWTEDKPVRMKEFNGLVSIEIFNLANRGKVFIKENKDGSVKILRDYDGYNKPKRMKDNPDYRYKFFPCPLCGKPMLGSRSRGKLGLLYSAYHCGGSVNGERSHKYIRIPNKQYEKTIKEYLGSLKANKLSMDSFEIVLNDVYRTREKEVVSQSALVSLNLGDLKSQQAVTLTALTNAQSPIVRKMLEDKVEELQKQIDDAVAQRDEIEITEKDIKTFIRYAKIIMEHPAKILMDIDDMRVQRTVFELIFETLPAYTEMLNGTPQLSLAFRLSGDNVSDKSQFVTLPGVEPGFKA